MTDTFYDLLTFFQKLFVITPSFSCQFFQDIISRPAAVYLTPLNGSSFSPAFKIETSTFGRERRGGWRTWTEQIMFSAHIICLPGDHTKARENWGRDGKKNLWLAANPSSVRCSSILAAPLYLAPPQSGQRGPSATGNKWLGRMGQRLSASWCHTREEGDLEKHLRGIMIIITTLKWNFNRFIVMRARFDFYQRPPCGPLLHPEI